METLLRKYKDTVGRIVSVTVDKKIAHKYTINSALYDTHGNAIALTSYSYRNRKKCFSELANKYPREKREHLARI